ncbi:MAG: hypothetical protein A2329_00415 [Sulfurimonas sp. RIFOXYB2_FULL_37_5]|uniref:hypothetical protein n=1 Tax=Sulfurimonas sp. RIFOXYB12_FULL_35_9 TaxID=1802256 RepID=UPI0008BE15BC|nr:hypothetical protein [Sulfurimonas sp. RIFOXYB12_FULL_35_9]OHE05113.1 MAG: hypothetical protein A2345_09205 [Sulfurimonas sp. RIFOXYB12_FULL_35_9]OHE15499.1 MAG: hypothetical protein A2329_00415 [Sulfurimonas sp. RIFOXYB2_FULL_37_5]
MNLFKLLLLLFITVTLSFADGKDLAKSLKLDPSSKAIKQWEKIFESSEKMGKMGIDKLSDADKAELKKYLTSHAADSDHPAAAGI